MARVTSIARRYGQAYFDLADDTGDLEEWGRGLAIVARALGVPEVAAAVRNPKLPLRRRVDMALDLVQDAPAPAQNLARLLVERHRTPLLPEIVAHYEELADRASGVVRAEIVTAVPVEDSVQRRISEVLSQRFGASVRTAPPEPSHASGRLAARCRCAAHAARRWLMPRGSPGGNRRSSERSPAVAQTPSWQPSCISPSGP